MRLEEARLLIVVEDTDYRAYLSGELKDKKIADILSQQTRRQEDQRSLYQESLQGDQPDHPIGITTLPNRLQAQANAIDLHVLSAAAYWRSRIQQVAICSLYAPTPYSELSLLGVRLIGSGLPESPYGVDSREGKTKKSDAKDAAGDRDRIRLVADFCPTHIVLCTPNYAVLSWATQNQIPSVVLLSDWQEPLGWQQQWHHRKLIRQLNHESVSWVGSRGAHACKILEASGISARKLIPWSWPPTELLEQYSAKQLRYDRAEVNLAYTGSLRTAAGVSDLLSAVSHLHQKGTAVHLLLLGDAADEPALAVRQKQAQQLGIAEHVTFILGASESDVIARVRAADLVVIPGYDRSAVAEVSRRLQLAMATRTPIVAADYPHLKEHLLHGVNAMIFPAGNAKSMAHRIERIMGQPQLYNQLSEALEISLQAIKIPAQWAELIDRWLQSGQSMSAGADNYQNLCNWAFSSGRYQAIFSEKAPKASVGAQAQASLGATQKF